MSGERRRRVSRRWRPGAPGLLAALVCGCFAHESSAPETVSVSQEPSIESKIADPYAAMGAPTPAGPPVQPAQPAPPPAEPMRTMAIAERTSGPSLSTTVTGLFGALGAGSREAASEPEPERQAGKPGSEKLVVEAWVTVVTDDVQPVAQAIRRHVEEIGGHVTEDRVGGVAAASWEGQLKVRLPPATVPAFLDWLARQGDLVSRRVSATDVSRQFFDHEIALRNLELTLARLQKVLEHQSIKVEEILRVEQEMTRVRTQIEQIKGTLRWLGDAVAFSTVEIRLTGKRPIPRLADAKFHVGGRFGLLALTDPTGRQQVRYGGGAVLELARGFSFDLDALASPEVEGPTVLATLGGAAYTDFLGGGTRRFLNPYLGLRAGYARLDHRDLLLLAAEVGVELFQLKYARLELFVRPSGLLGSESDFALHGGAGLSVPF
ncbi:MAG TPA: DUF4349 domain-containing protein [Polyangia bacterium]|nr:DUF4349 domain-containing protein [Polyangia bacterium]